MIKSWQDFITEGSNYQLKASSNRYKRISRGEIIDDDISVEEILNKYTPWYDYKNVKTPLYRSVMVGTTTKPDFSFKIINPSKFKRNPPTTENYYNTIIDNSENWKEYPKRSRSVMTHTDEISTKKYGNKCFRVIPLVENSKCAYVEDDYWNAFPKLFKEWPFHKISGLEGFNKSLRDTFNLTKKNYTKSKLESLLSSSSINSQRSSMYEFTKSHLDKARKIENSSTIYEYIEKLMSPENSTVKLIEYNNDTKLPETDLFYNYEIWTESPCLLISNNLITPLQ